MKIGIIGTGSVGRAIGGKLASQGHEVKMGSRAGNHPDATAWIETAGATASQGTFAEAAAFGEIVFNCTKGEVSLQALEMAGADNLAGKILVDVANALDFSQGMPPALFPEYINTTSLAEQLQARFPETKVVKSLNTLNISVMVAPEVFGGQHAIFVSGNYADAKATVKSLLQTWGWQDIIDLGDITTARGTEMFMPLWVRLWGALGTPKFNIAIVRDQA